MKSAIICLLICFVAPLVSSDSAKDASFKQRFGLYEDTMNKAINNQIQIELQGHYTYLHLSHTFNEKSRYYPKVAQYFRAKADEEMQHAERFIQYQNQRGGQFKLQSITLPSSATIPQCNNVVTLFDAFGCAQALEIFVTKELTSLAKLASNVLCADSSACGQCGDACDVKVNELMKGQSVLVTYGSDTVPLYEYYEANTATSITKVEFIELEEMITHEFLGHQIEDTKEIANYFNTLKNFKSATKAETDSNDSDANKQDNVEKLASYLFDKNL